MVRLVDNIYERVGPRLSIRLADVRTEVETLVLACSMQHLGHYT